MNSFSLVVCIFFSSLAWAGYPGNDQLTAATLNPGLYEDYAIAIDPNTGTGKSVHWFKFIVKDTQCGFSHVNVTERRAHYFNQLEIKILDQDKKVLQMAKNLNNDQVIFINKYKPGTYYLTVQKGWGPIRTFPDSNYYYDLAYTEGTDCTRAHQREWNESPDQGMPMPADTFIESPGSDEATFRLSPLTNLWFIMLDRDMDSTKGGTLELDSPQGAVNLAILDEEFKVIFRQNDLKGRQAVSFKLPKDHKYFYVKFFSYSDEVRTVTLKRLEFERSRFLTAEKERNLALCGLITRCPDRSPLIVDWDGDGFSLSGNDGAIRFDLTGTGNPKWINWVTPGSRDSFFAIDLNNNSMIDGGRELFGVGTDMISMGGIKALNGFIALEQYDQLGLGGNGDGSINIGDSVWSRLLLWTDTNADGISQPGEVRPISKSRLQDIELWPRARSTVDRHGNALSLWAKVKTDWNQFLDVVDVDFRRYP